jgi:hypothetical protein
MKVFGIDISTWQRGYPYSKATKDGVKFAILRAGFGTTKDNQFETHYKNARKQGWGIGAYWYTYATTVSEAKKEAEAFLKAIKGKKFEYPIYLDIEDKSIRKAGKSTLDQIVKTFGDIIERAGYYYGVYTNYDWYRNVISGSSLNSKYDWWIASWTKSMPSVKNAGLWQFGGSSNAIRSNKVGGVITDQNYALKDYPNKMKQMGKNGYAKTTVVEKVKEKVSPAYKPGTYITTTEVNVRAGAGTKYRLKKVKELSLDGQRHATAKTPNAYACYKKGTVFTAVKIVKEGYNYWAQTPSGYVCIQYGKDKYCKRK